MILDKTRKLNSMLFFKRQWYIFFIYNFLSLILISQDNKYAVDSTIGLRDIINKKIQYHGLEKIVINKETAYLLDSLFTLTEIKNLKLLFHDKIIIPSSISKLKNLESIELIGAGGDMIPKEFENLSELISITFVMIDMKNLKINFSNFKKLKNLVFMDAFNGTEFPIGVQNCNNLERLEVHNLRGLKYSLPENMSLLTKLKFLHLGAHKIKGDIVTSFEGLEQLEHLSISVDDQRRLILELSELNNLKYLWIISSKGNITNVKITKAPLLEYLGIDGGKHIEISLFKGEHSKLKEIYLKGKMTDVK